jgi:hypothetical protein
MLLTDLRRGGDLDCFVKSRNFLGVIFCHF